MYLKFLRYALLLASAFALMLGTWSCQNLGQRGSSAQHAELKAFIHKYFTSWSNKDIGGYRSCFWPEASIQLLGAGGTVTLYQLQSFIETQRHFLESTQLPVKEEPISVDIQFERELARIFVHWKLTHGTEIKYGYNHFLLMKHDGTWRILSLVFYNV